ncbi:MAG: alpha/beta hydrolase, partial [Candidatus Brocadiales bacterium]
GVLTYPQYGDPVNAILLCSPHPQFAGNMDNNIITALSQFLARDSVTLRFDYRGVGESQIDLPAGVSVFDYWGDIEEGKNYDDAVTDVASAGAELLRITGGILPLIAIGYSFGAITAFLYGKDNNSVRLMVGIAPPLGKVSFDFLSECDKPNLMIIGKGDFLYSAEEVEKFAKTGRDARFCVATDKNVCPTTEIDLLDDCDHFFRGNERLIAEKVDSFIRNNTPPTPSF